MAINKNELISRFADTRESARSTKADREKLEKDIQKFLDNGGEIEQVPIDARMKKPTIQFTINASVPNHKRGK